MNTTYQVTNLSKQHRSALSVPSNADAAYVRNEQAEEFMIVASLSNVEFTVYGNANEVILKANLILGAFKDAMTGKQVGYWECVDATGGPQGSIEEKGPLGGLLAKSRWYRTHEREFLVFRRNQRHLELPELGIIASRPKFWSTDVEAVLCPSQYISFPTQLLLLFMFWQESQPE